MNFLRCLFNLQIVLFVCKSKNSNFVSLKDAAGADYVWNQHGQATVIVKPPNVDGPLPLLSLELGEIVDDSLGKRSTSDSPVTQFYKCNKCNNVCIFMNVL